VLQGAAVTDSGASFTVVVTNDLGTATSAPAIVTVLVLPVAALPALPAELALSKSQTASSNFTLVRRSDGSVASWGFNNDGERGDGTTGTSSATPGTVTLPAGTRAVSVAAGETHGLVLLNTGDVYSWGLNAFGQLGFGDNIARPTPAKVPLSLPAIAIAAGRDFSVAVLNDGTVVTWGLNDAGQMADGTLVTRLSPVLVAGLSGIVSVAAGNGHVLALTAAGTVWSWGSNAAGQLGDGTYRQRRAPALLPVNGIARIRAGGDISVLITTHRIAYGFGENGGAELVPTGVDVGTPTSVLTDAVDAGPADTLLLVTRSDGTVSASGINEAGSLGDGTTTARSTFQPVTVVTGALTAAAGGRSFSAALRSDGTVLTWGDNSSLQLGNSALSTTAGTTTPTVVPGFDAIP
jgi:alpha-tubulin suppressor-like RCC1 family protein